MSLRRPKPPIKGGSAPEEKEVAVFKTSVPLLLFVGGQTFRTRPDLPSAYAASRTSAGSLCRDYVVRGVGLTTQPHLAPRLKEE